MKKFNKILYLEHINMEQKHGLSGIKDWKPLKALAMRRMENLKWIGFESSIGKKKKDKRNNWEDHITKKECLMSTALEAKIDRMKEGKNVAATGQHKYQKEWCKKQNYGTKHKSGIQLMYDLLLESTEFIMTDTIMVYY